MNPPDIFTNILALSTVLDPNDQFEIRMINNAGGQILYLGKALTPSADTSKPIWYVKKFSFDVNGFLNYVQLPNNGVGFFYIWDDVTTYF
jgi:hypothetical protein